MAAACVVAACCEWNTGKPVLASARAVRFTVEPLAAAVAAAPVEPLLDADEIVDEADELAEDDDDDDDIEPADAVVVGVVDAWPYILTDV